MPGLCSLHISQESFEGEVKLTTKRWWSELTGLFSACVGFSACPTSPKGV